MIPLISRLLLIGLICWANSVTRAESAATVSLIGPDTDVPENKESDWIYGDYLLQNEHVIAVIGQPKSGRNANMTVRGVGACVIDLTNTQAPNDQISAIYPAGGRFHFHDAKRMRLGTLNDDGKQNDAEQSDSQSQAASGEAVFWECDSSESLGDKNLKASVRYELHSGEAFVRMRVTVESSGDKPLVFPVYDGVRADKTFLFTRPSGNEQVVYCTDEFFGQTYGFASPNPDAKVAWKSGGRMRTFTLDDKATVAENSQSVSWTTYLIPATSGLDLASAAAAALDAGAESSWQVIRISDDAGPVARAVLEFDNRAEQDLPAPQRTLRLGDDGIARARLSPGQYTVHITAPGHPPHSHALQVGSQAGETLIQMPTAAARTRAKITDTDGTSIPCKVAFYAADNNTTTPNFGPDSAAGSIVNCVYCVDGNLNRSIDPGKYELVISRGPEYDAVFRTIEVKAGQTTQFEATLPRTVNTPGWVSAELHSHSTPSGDNTSLQRGRVENLLCEHLEFAPCTEHNRITTYVPHLEAMHAQRWMATCTGMELTGNPLPVNHQNAFPLHHHPHEQDGGGPQTDPNPVVQIERLAMWDDGSEKLVQGNHPNIAQQFGDRNTDGKPDQGFKEMFGFMDVIEVHPPEAIFEAFDEPEKIGKNRIAQWMQLLNQGTRVPGVVNTDAHYNHHGSGWLRNWFASSTDEPAKISVDEMIHAAEHGHIIMSSGPYMSVQVHATHQDDPAVAIPGEDIIADGGKCQVAVRVQCPNWLDVNRVQIFVNGRSTEALNFTRKTHPEYFADEIVKFEQTIPVTLAEDAHLIVATIGEELTLKRVMGDTYGDRPPCAVSNPVFVDLQGDGFDHNHDDLGHPLPGAKSPKDQN